MNAFLSVMLLAFMSLQSFAHDPYETFSIGDRIQRDYGIYANVPTTVADASAQGWSALGPCEPNLGIPYAQSASGPERHKPIVMYFTPAGQAAGAGVVIFAGTPETSLINQGWFQQLSNGNYYISVTFRNASSVCSNSPSEYPLGDRLIVNADTIAHYLPTTEKEAVQGQWTKGSCFDGMGTHYFYDLATAPRQSWVAGNLLPIVPMYYNGVINAFFFASTVVQQTLFPPETNDWEPVYLPNSAMCKNWCSSSCTFSGTKSWSTLHMYLRDRTNVKCGGGCTIACCN